MSKENCKIGQQDRCEKGGCEWKKAFGNYCWMRSEAERANPFEIKPNFTPKTNPNPVKKKKQKCWPRKRGRFVKSENKYVENNRYNKVEEHHNEFGITTEKPDPLFSKIKTVGNNSNWP